MPSLPRLRRLAGVACLLASGVAGASSYLLSEDEVYYRGALGQSSATQAFDAAGTLSDLGCTEQRTMLDNQLEYGQSYWHTLFGHVALGQARCGERTRTGVGDLNVGLRGRVNRYLNYRAWEIDATVPLDRGSDRLGCGAYGVGGNLERADRWRYFAVDYGASLQLWQAPLAHRLGLGVQGTGPVGVREYTPWSWLVAFSGETPLVKRPVDPLARANDCGTQSQVVRATTGLRYHMSREVSLGCDFAAVIAGQDVNRTLALSCGYSYLWH